MGFFGAWIIRAFYVGLNLCVMESINKSHEKRSKSVINNKELLLQLFKNQIAITLLRLVDKVIRESLAVAKSYTRPLQFRSMPLVLCH